MSAVRTEILADSVVCYLGDCREVLPTLGKVDAVVTDPPYGNANHDGDFNARLNDYRGLENKPIANDDADSMRDVVDAMLTSIVPLMPKEASVCCCFCGGGGAETSVRMVGRADGSWRSSVLSFSNMGQAQSWTRSALSKAA